MNTFNYSYPVKVYFGKGSAKEAFSNELKKYGSKVLLAYGGGSIKSNGIYDEIVSALKEENKEIIEFNGIMSNPTYKKVQAGVELVKKEKIDFILAVGGGSVIDCCKVISTQATIDEDIWDLEYVKGQFSTTGIPMGGCGDGFRNRC